MDVFEKMPDLGCLLGVELFLEHRRTCLCVLGGNAIGAARGIVGKRK